MLMLLFLLYFLQLAKDVRKYNKANLCTSHSTGGARIGSNKHMSLGSGGQVTWRESHSV